MFTGRQITWMIYQHFKVSATDGAMLDWDELLSVELKGDNPQQLSSDWESTIFSIDELPDEKFLESIYRKQLEKSDQLKNAIGLYRQDIIQRGEEKSYEKLKKMVQIHLDKLRLERNKSA